MKKLISLLMVVVMLCSLGFAMPVGAEEEVNYQNKICTIENENGYLILSPEGKGKGLTVGETATQWRLKGFLDKSLCFINGDFAADQQKCLREIGEFMTVNGEAIYGTRGGPVQPVDYVYGTTNKGNNIYVHITDYAKFAELTVPVDYEIITKATMLDGSEVTVEKVEGGIKITVPEEKIAAIDTVVKLEVTTMPEIQK